ncbi:hypothetical protein B0T26DRAFT_679006 [Lasiosphaeria miniovina]|uniref:Uncharacterized protein n=1 Tax=Lasiosphaeria miniovina TaxID=1954250 RepID=A0AA40A5H9_9PEZI|nr:uncharacterized protein B0T26DRAFT_679006 [Lasiosphaeria miniovina]KAK0709615.1 hypothetical protein B0T26DRAFT_679006 [Lasiosphaeria miniovina]
MRRLRISSLLPVSLALAATAAANSIVYVTDLTVYTALAPCAQNGLRYNVMGLTAQACPEAVTDLQACVCTKNQNFGSIASAVSSSVAYYCGSTASQDQASVSTVLSVYCNQDATVAFPTPVTPVSAYITDFPEFGNLAYCASYYLSYVVNSLTQDACPTDATALASCACSKNQNSLVISQDINTSVKSACSGHTADVSSAQAMFAAYCALNNGTSAFPQTTNPPGDMTYYISDLPQYSSLAPCAANALSYAVLRQTAGLCPTGPMALASCACFKDGMTSNILSQITSYVKEGCASTATDDISSAVGVYDFYCNAANAKVTADGVTNSVSQPTPTRSSGSKFTGNFGGTGGGSTGSSGGSGSNNGNGSGSSSGTGTGNGIGGSTAPATSDTANKGGPSTGVIAGVVVGVVAVLAIVGVLVFFLVKQAQKRKAASHHALPENASPSNYPDPYGGKHELASEAVAAGAVAGAGAGAGAHPPPSPSPSTLKVAGPPRTDNVSPVSAHAHTLTPPPNKLDPYGQAQHPPLPNSAELYGQNPAYSPAPNTAELYAQGGHQYPPHANRPELQGHGAPYSPAGSAELYAQGSGQYPPANRPELQGQGAPYPPPNRPELMGQYGYPQQQQQQPPHQGYYSPQTPQGPQQPPVELQNMVWQSGPVPGYYEMDGSRNANHNSLPGHAR